MSKETNKGITAYRDGDYATALAEFTSLAKAGNAKAQYYLGLMHDNGYGTPQNYAEAAKCYRPAAEAGIAEAQYALGLIYLLGKGVIESDAITYVWFSLATAQGLKIAEKSAMMWHVL